MKNNWSIKVKKTYFADNCESGSGEFKGSIPSRVDLCQNDSVLEEAYDHLFVEWIGVDELIMVLCERYTHATYFNGRPVVLELLRSGLFAYAKTLVQGSKHYYPNQRLMHFIEACIAKATVIGDIEITDIDKGDTWTTMSEEPLYKWGRNRVQLVIKNVTSRPEEFAGDLYGKIVPKNFKLVMRRFRHEATIVVGSVGCCA